MGYIPVSIGIYWRGRWDFCARRTLADILPQLSSLASHIWHAQSLKMHSTMASSPTGIDSVEMEQQANHRHHRPKRGDEPEKKRDR